MPGTLLDDTLEQQLRNANWQNAPSDNNAYGEFANYLRSYGVSNLSDLKWNDGTLSDDLSAADRQDMWGGQKITPGNATGETQTIGRGYMTPSGQIIQVGDVFHPGSETDLARESYSLNQGADGSPVFGSHQIQSQNIGPISPAMIQMATMAVIGGAAMGGAGLFGQGAAAGGGEAVATGGGAVGGGGGVAGAANGMWDVLPEAVGGGGGELAGAANGMWDVLPEAASSDGSLLTDGLVTPEAGQGTLLEGGGNGIAAPGEDWAPGEVSEAGDYGPAAEGYNEGDLPTEADVGDAHVPDATDADYRNGADINSDIATETGVAPAGSVNSGVVTNAPGGYWNGNAITDPADFPGNGEGDGAGDGEGDGAGEGDTVDDPGLDDVPGDLPFDWGDFLKAFLGGLGSLLGGGGGDINLNGGAGPAFVPEQPVVGAGQGSNGTAQGGASGSLQGIAGTLLTSKDTFGYGRTTAG
jgi:hypothetical protein